MTPEQLMKLRKQLAIDEGQKLEVYADHLGVPTVGTGHKVLPGDNLNIGDSISQEQSDGYLNDDLQVAIGDAMGFVGEDTWKTLTPDRQNVLANMAYNLGGPNLNTFKNFRSNIQQGDWKGAGTEMMNSKWAGQVGDRANRLNKRFVEGYETTEWDQF